jgi:hypothetical protein
LYFIIAATASAGGMVPGAAVSYPFGIISIMNRIVTLRLISSHAGCAWRATVALALTLKTNELLRYRRNRRNHFC